jgi:pyridoxamine 5'-phosphate oxidase-like protein
MSVRDRHRSRGAANIRRDPRASVCALSDEFGGVRVHLDGTAEVFELPESLGSLVEYFRRPAGVRASGRERS